MHKMLSLLAGFCKRDDNNVLVFLSGSQYIYTSVDQHNV